MPSSLTFKPRPGRLARGLSLAAALGLSTAAAAHAREGGYQNDYRNKPGEAFTVLRKSPDVVIRFTGLTLKQARTDPARNEIILYFTGEADRNVFDNLETVLPNWVDTAYSGYDSAEIRATRPVTFMTRNHGHGFDLRMVARDGAPAASNQEPALRGQIGVGDRGAKLARLKPPPASQDDGLRGADYAPHRSAAIEEAMRLQPLAATQGLEGRMPKVYPTFAVSGGWRHPEHGSIITADLAGGIPVGGGLRLIGSVHESYAKGKAVRTLAGTAEALNEDAVSAAAGIALNLGSYSIPAELRGEALWGKSGWGGRLAYAQDMRGGGWGAALTFRGPDDDTLEAVADRAYRSGVVIGFVHRLIEGLWGQATLHVTRYGVDSDRSIASTAGASASLRYMADLGGLWAGIGYEFHGDYVLDSHKYLGAWPTPFTPLDIRTYEVHALSGSLSGEVFEGLWFDAYGGYAIDRYGPDGYFGGGDLSYRFAPGWALALSGGYSQVSTRQGERGAKTSAGLKLVYDWGADRHSPTHPISHGYFSNL